HECKGSMNFFDRAHDQTASGSETASYTQTSVEERVAPDVADGGRSESHPPGPGNNAKSVSPGSHAGPKESNMEDFATVLENFEAAQTEAQAALEHKAIAGTVVKLTPTHVVVDFGSKSEGLVPIAQVQGPDGNPTFKPGDEILVVV